MILINNKLLQKMLIYGLNEIPFTSHHYHPVKYVHNPKTLKTLKISRAMTEAMSRTSTLSFQ